VLFNEADLDNLLADESDVIIKLNGVTVKPPIKGKLRKRTEIASPHTADTVLVIPSLLCKDSDLVGVDRTHTLTVDGVAYKLYGDADPQNSGLTRIGLVKA